MFATGIYIFMISVYSRVGNAPCSRPRFRSVQFLYVLTSIHTDTLTYLPLAHASNTQLIACFPASSPRRHRGSRRRNLISRRPNNTNPTPPVSLSSLRALTATSSAYNPPSPPLFSSSSASSPSPSPSSSSSRPPSPIGTVIDDLSALNLSSSSSQPIPIPKPASTAAARDHLPVTPLTGRFEKGCYFASQLHQSPPEERETHSSHKNYSRHPCRRRRRDRPRPPHHHHHHHNHHNVSRMRPDSSNFYSPVVSSTMPSSSASSQPSQPRSQNNKSVPAFHLGNLPRFFPPSSSQNTVGQHTYRRSSGSSRGDGTCKYREMAESMTVPRTTSGQHSPSPSAPRLDPLNSPGPVTPLALEESGNYLASGMASNSGNPSSREPPNLSAVSEPIERLIAREAEHSRQRSNKTSTKGR